MDLASAFTCLGRAGCLSGVPGAGIVQTWNPSSRDWQAWRRSIGSGFHRIDIVPAGVGQYSLVFVGVGPVAQGSDRQALTAYGAAIQRAAQAGAAMMPPPPAGPSRVPLQYGRPMQASQARIIPSRRVASTGLSGHWLPPEEPFAPKEDTRYTEPGAKGAYVGSSKTWRWGGTRSAEIAPVRILPRGGTITVSWIGREGYYGGGYVVLINSTVYPPTAPPWRDWTLGQGKDGEPTCFYAGVYDKTCSSVALFYNIDHAMRAADAFIQHAGL